MLIGGCLEGYGWKFKLCFVPYFFRDMFSVPPQKLGMEVVLHFLFSQLNSHLCYEEFRDCWPVYDHKQDQLFRKKSANWITGIAKVTKKLVD